ncbi:hypothetical protein [Cryptosporangium sp. NPDC048952]|uniref:hypothetical protein n=1 Tax=Cryptosporangium sp. NPDC048952 TaxID=3363961 RepID=UPI0037203FF6
MNTGPQSRHQGGADEGEAAIKPPTFVPADLSDLTPLPHQGNRAPAPPTVARPLPTTVLWRWRYETAVLGGAPLLWWAGVRSIGGLAGLSIVTGLLAFVALIPPLRRWLTAVLWTVVTPHRVRVACAEAGVVSPSGKLPGVLCTVRKPYGERVYLWCPPGLGPADVAAARSVIAAACWANDAVFYQTSGQYPQFVAVDVIRLSDAVVEPEPMELPAVWERFARHDGRFEGFAPRTR